MSRVTLITGANTGIGFELTHLLAEKNNIVYLGARNEVAGKEAVEKLHAKGLKNVKYAQLDITKLTTIHAAEETIEKAEGKLDVLVNNAAIANFSHDQNAMTIVLDTIRDVMETNFYGLIQTTQIFLPLLRKSSYGVIVNVSSGLGSNTYQASPTGNLRVVAYSATKSAVNSYTIALAHELRIEGIKVNAVTPGITSTNLNSFIEGGKSVKEGAEGILPLALLDKDGPTGMFFNSDGIEFPWRIPHEKT